MKLLCALLLFFAFASDDVPLKPKEEFDLQLTMEFRSRHMESTSVVYSTESTRRTSGPLPYLQFNLSLLKLPGGESRIRVINNRNENILAKKVEVGSVLKLDMGFTDDLKGHRGGCAYTILFLTSNKKPASRIVIHFEEDGTYLVNGEKRGKV